MATVLDSASLQFPCRVVTGALDSRLSRGGETGEFAISKKVFVGNLSFDVTREELLEAFAAAGTVVDAKVPTDRETGRPRGFAFVEFASDEQAQKSIELLNGKSLKGRPLRVNEAENRPPRPPGAAGGPSGGGYRPPSFRPSGPPPMLAPEELASRGREDRRRTRDRSPKRFESEGRRPPPRRRQNNKDDFDLD